MEKLAIHGGTPVFDAPFFRGWPGIQEYGLEEAENVIKVLKNRSPFRYYGPNLQKMVKTFEAEFKERFGMKNAVAVTSGTASLMVALKAAGIGPGDKVIVPACTFLATPGAVVCAGAVPVFCDVDDTLHIDPTKIGNVVDKYTKAIITVPLQGSPCQMDAVVAEAKKYGLIVIEDCAQSMGSSLNGKPMGTWGDIGCFSLQMNKLITTGEGGIVVTNNDKFYERAVRYHDQGMFREKEGFLTDAADEVLIGQNYRMSEITGAVALAQLRKLDKIIARSSHIKKYMTEELKNVKGLTIKREIDPAGDVGAALTLFAETPEKTKEFNAAMNAENVCVGSLYEGRPVYMLPQIFYQRTFDRNGFPFNQFDEPVVYTADMCPQANYYMPRNINISLSAEYTDEDVEKVIYAVKKVAAGIL